METVEAANYGNMKGVYTCRHTDMLKDRNGNLFTTVDEMRKRWGENLDKMLDRPASISEADIDEETERIDGIETGCITRTKFELGIWCAK